ncbi:MAG: hypothetical protein AB4290_07310, partial [Spirulina sp.]
MRLSLVSLVVLTASTTLSPADSALATAEAMAEEMAALTEETPTLGASDRSPSWSSHKTREKSMTKFAKQPKARQPEDLASADLAIVTENESAFYSLPELSGELVL